MATDQTEFQIWLKSKWDGDALKAAEADFRKTQKAVKDTDTSMQDAGYSAKNLKAQLLELVAFAEVVAQFKEGFEQVAKLEQIFNQLERQTKRNGDNFDEVKGKIVGFADQLKKVAGLDDDAVIAGMTKLYTATKDVNQAMVLARLSADIAIATGKDYAAAQDLVMSAAQGNVRALRELGLSFETTGDKSKDAEIALAKLQKTFGGSAEGAKGLTVEINRMKEGWEDVRNTVVERVTPGISAAIKTVQTFFTALDAAWGFLADGLVRTITVIGKFGSYLKSVATGDMDGMKSAVKAMGQELAGIGTDAVSRAQAAAKKIEAIWAESKNKISGGEGPAKGLGAGAGEGGKTTFEMDPRILEENFVQEQLRKIREKMEDERQKEIEKFNKWEKDKGVLAYKEKVRLEKDLTKAREEEMHERSQLILAEVKLQKAADAAKRAGAEATIGAAMGFAREAFGESKELAIAETAINTWQGAARALKDWPAPYSYAIAALTIAMGLAQVAKIESTDPTKGTGFDDPRNDAAARMGGRRWAADMISEFSSGASQGWAQGMAGIGSSTTTNDNRRTFNVHVHGAGLIDPANVQMAKQFKRTLDLIDTQYEGQRSIARRQR